MFADTLGKCGAKLQAVWYISPQLYAQVKALYESGFIYWFADEDKNRIDRHNIRFELPDLEAELILHYFRKPLEYERGKFMTAAEIYQRISYGIRFPLALNRITGLMKQLGFKYVRSLNRRGFLVAEEGTTLVSGR